MLTNYTYYKEVFHGDLLTEDNYEKYAQAAFVWLDYFTFGAYSRIEAQRSGFNSERTSSGATEPSRSLGEASGCGTCEDEAECAVADLWYQLQTEQASNPAISKETVGSHSVTYRTGTEAASSWAARIYDTAARYLLTTGLLYRGAILEFKL